MEELEREVAQLLERIPGNFEIDPGPEQYGERCDRHACLPRPSSLALSQPQEILLQSGVQATIH